MNNLPQLIEEVSVQDHGKIRDFIHGLEEQIKLCGEIVEVPVEHYFSKDVYAREMKLTKGMVIIGKIHKFENLNILSEGEVSVLSIDGLMKVKAPYTFVGSPGAKRLIVANTDCTWTTIHGTSETDVDKIEEKFIAKNYEQLLENEEKLCLG